MKSIASFFIAAALTVGLAGVAQATPYEAFEADVMEALPSQAAPALDHPHHHCHGLASGMAHQSCGSRTGGPSGSLF